jgi:hypothetical protein
MWEQKSNVHSNMGATEQCAQWHVSSRAICKVTWEQQSNMRMNIQARGDEKNSDHSHG